jgi:hypothetical protein
LEFLDVPGERSIWQDVLDEFVEHVGLEQQLWQDARHVGWSHCVGLEGGDELAQPGRGRCVGRAEPGLGGLIPELHGSLGEVQTAAESDGEAADGVDVDAGDRGEIVERDHRVQRGERLGQPGEFQQLEMTLVDDPADLSGEEAVQ